MAHARNARIADARRRIADGTLETPEAIDGTIEGLLCHVAPPVAVRFVPTCYLYMGKGGPAICEFDDEQEADR